MKMVSKATIRLGEMYKISIKVFSMTPELNDRTTKKMLFALVEEACRLNGAWQLEVFTSYEEDESSELGENNENK